MMPGTGDEVERAWDSGARARSAPRPGFGGMQQLRPWEARRDLICGGLAATNLLREYLPTWNGSRAAMALCPLIAASK